MTCTRRAPVDKTRGFVITAGELNTFQIDAAISRASFDHTSDPIHKEADVDEDGGPLVEVAVDAPGGDCGQHGPAGGPVVGEGAARVSPAQAAARRRLRARHRTRREAEEDQTVQADVIRQQRHRHLLQLVGEDGTDGGGS